MPDPTPTPVPPTPAPTPEPTPTPKPRDPPSRADIDRVVQRYGGERAALAHLYDDNLSLRQYRRIAKGTATPDDIRAVLPAGFVLSPKADADDLAAFRALGKADELKQRLTDATRLQGELAEQQRTTLYARAAELAGLNPKAFAKAAKAEGLHVEVREEQVDGKAVKVAYVRKAEAANDPLVKLAEYATAHLTDYALTAASPPPTTGPRVPAQRASGTTEPKSALATVTGRYKSPGQMAAKQ